MAKNSIKAKKAKASSKALKAASREIFAALNPDQIRMGLTLLVNIGRPLAKYTKTKVDDAAVAFIEMVIEPGNLERIFDALEVKTAKASAKKRTTRDELDLDEEDD
jgi:hypothetical protein